MTVGEFIGLTSNELKRAGIETARLDSVIMLEDALHKDRAILLAHPEEKIPSPILADLYKKRIARERHTPLAYIRGKAMFYGREFIVNENVLVPRPETEDIIDLLKVLRPDALHIADIGTGSGCIGITAKLELPKATVDLYDIDVRALSVAQRNCAAYHLLINCYQSDLLPKDIDYDVILANLPYIPEEMTINRAAMHEPHVAIFSGVDGLNHYKTLWKQLYSARSKPKLVITESLASQHHINAVLARKNGYYLTRSQGLAQAFCPID